jgi:hypothetical protein
MAFEAVHSSGPEILKNGQPIFCALQVVQLFESWAHHLSPQQFEEFGKPYAEQVLQGVKKLHPETPVIYHANGGDSRYLRNASSVFSTRPPSPSSGCICLGWIFFPGLQISIESAVHALLEGIPAFSDYT